MSPPLVLAIHEDTNANAALLRGGEILAAVAEERLTRVKFQAGHPARAVAQVLALGGVTADDLDAVVAGNRFHFLPRLLGGAAIGGDHDLLGPRHKAWLQLQARFQHPGPVAHGLERLGAGLLARRFGRPVPLVDHHTAHAASAWLTSGWPAALAVSVDNMGDGFSARVFRCQGGRLEPLWGSGALDSPGQFYGEISQFLGFRILDAGKVTGLAARGDPRPAYGVMARLFRLSPDGTAFRLTPLWPRSHQRGLYRELGRFSREEVAAAAQRRLEDVLLAFVRHALEETGLRHLVLAGGVFANVLLNQRLWHLPQVDGLFVHPAMTDQGIALGAAATWLLERGAIQPQPLDHVYLGPDIHDEEVGRRLQEEHMPAERCADVDARVAELLARGQVVARVRGRMEYGPRALGHRSILYHTRDPSVNNWLNRRLSRAEFMPFAPATLEERAGDCYTDYGPGVAHTARFMTITLRCSDTMRRQSPAVVHVDGTARPQVVDARADPDYHRLLRLYEERSGIPSIINTSCNIHGEPIVCSVDDAIRFWRRGVVDAMALGSFLLQQESPTRGA